jgi:hypothetical protein
MLEELSGTDMMSIKNARCNDNQVPPKIIIADDKFINIEHIKLKLSSIGLD